MRHILILETEFFYNDQFTVKIGIYDFFLKKHERISACVLLATKVRANL